MVVGYRKKSSSVISDAASVHSQQHSAQNTPFDNIRAAEQTGLRAFEMLTN